GAVRLSRQPPLLTLSIAHSPFSPLVARRSPFKNPINFILSFSSTRNMIHTTIGCGKQGFPSAQPYLSHTPSPQERDWKALMDETVVAATAV
ncbi:hypothetical protein N7465_003913, partial [Penicillium sp. CMV-2018d]